MPTKTRFFQTEHQAIQTARSRAKTAYSSQLIYQNNEGFFIRGKYNSQKKPDEKPLIEVRWDGNVLDLRKEQA